MSEVDRPPLRHGQFGPDAPDTSALEAKLKEMKAKIDADKRKEIEAEVIGRLERGIRGEEGIWPDWVYECRRALQHQRDNTPYLDDLLRVLGWQGGTYQQVVSAVARLVEADKEANKPRCEACGWPAESSGRCMRLGCCNNV